MRILMLGSAAILLSGCSFLGIGGQKNAYKNYNPQPAYYGQQQAVQTAPRSQCTNGNCLARWNLEGGVGTSFNAGRNILTASRTNNVAGTDFNSVSFADAYETGIRTELGGSYALSPNRKVTLLGHYEQSDGAGTQNFGTIGGEAITGNFSDYKQFGAELGLRQYFKPRKGFIVNSFRPYVEGRAGIARVGDIELNNAQLGGAAFNGSTVPLYVDSWVPSAAGLVGIETPLTRYSTIGIESGVRYQGGLESDTSVLGAGTPLGGLNNNGGRLSVPLTLRGRYRF